jgi:hypothetical protein
VVVELTSTGADSGDSAAGGGSQSGGITNPFVGGVGGARVDSHNPHASAYTNGPQGEFDGGRVGEEENRKFASLTLKRDESGRPYYSISNHAPDGIDSDLDDNRWFAMKNIRFGPDDIDKVTIVVGTAISVIVGVVNLYLRSLSLLGFFFSFPLWSPVDPVPVLMLATKERKRRRKQGQRDTDQENRDGRLGRLLDDDRHTA